MKKRLNLFNSFRILLGCLQKTTRRQFQNSKIGYRITSNSPTPIQVFSQLFMQLAAILHCQSKPASYSYVKKQTLTLRERMTTPLFTSQLAEFISLILVQYFIRITQMLVKYCFKILDQYIFAPEFLGSQYFFQVILPVLVKYTVFCQ